MKICESRLMVSLSAFFGYQERALMILFVNKSCLIVVFVILCTGVVKLLAHIIGRLIETAPSWSGVVLL